MVLGLRGMRSERKRRLILLVASRPQRGVHTHLGRGCPVRRFCFAATRPFHSSPRGRGGGPRVRPEGLPAGRAGGRQEYACPTPDPQPRPSSWGHLLANPVPPKGEAIGVRL